MRPYAGDDFKRHSRSGDRTQEFSLLYRRTEQLLSRGKDGHECSITMQSYTRANIHASTVSLYFYYNYAQNTAHLLQSCAKYGAFTTILHKQNTAISHMTYSHFIFRYDRDIMARKTHQSHSFAC